MRAAARSLARGLSVALGLGAVAPGAAAGPADVLSAKVECDAERVCRFDVTVRHADVDFDHYADAWDVIAPDGSVLGSRALQHPHVNEQPFTRSLEGVLVPPGVDRVRIQAHDSLHGWGGVTLVLEIPE